jgi:hypothetical protein
MLDRQFLVETVATHWHCPRNAADKYLPHDVKGNWDVPASWKTRTSTGIAPDLPLGLS